VKTSESVHLPSGDDSIAPVSILDADGRVVSVVSAEEFRRTHPNNVAAVTGDRPRVRSASR
jgi:hypothetical protein